MSSVVKNYAPQVIAAAIVAVVFAIAPGTRPAGLSVNGGAWGLNSLEDGLNMAVHAKEPKGAAGARAWTASAPGKVEPRNGEIKITAQAPGRIVEVLVKINDTVKAGDLLIRLDDEEARARLRAALALADARKRARDNTDVNRLADKRREADDKVFEARIALFRAREDLDEEAAKFRQGSSSAAKLDDARQKVRDAKTALLDARKQLRKAQSAKKIPLETTRESALSAARAEVALTEAALRHTQIRAPVDGTVLDVIAKIGEMAIPSPQNVLLRFGDMTALRVRAEVEERDVGNVRVGQRVKVRSGAFPGKEFSGKVATRARTLGPNKIAAKGLRRPTDLDVLEALIDLDDMPPLLPGMRVDVYFMSEAAAKDKAAAKSAKASGPTN